MSNSQSQRSTHIQPLHQEIQEFAGQILSHLSQNLSQAASEQFSASLSQPAASARGRSTRRGSTRGGSTRGGPQGRTRPRSVSFNTQCACGPVCVSATDTNCSPSLNPEARSFVPGERASSSRNVARRSRPRAIRSGLVRPSLRPVHHHAPGYQNPLTGRVEPEEDRSASPPLFPPSFYQAGTGGTRPPTPRPSNPVLRGERSGSTPPPPLAPASPPRLPSPPVLPPRDPLVETLPASPPPRRERSPILEPDSPIPDREDRNRVQLRFFAGIAPQFQSEVLELRKSHDYSCTCLNSKSRCTCSEAILDVVLRVRYKLTDPARYQARLGGNES